MSGPLQKLQHQLCWCLILAFCMAGCSGRSDQRESFESSTESGALPRGWALTSASGTYQTAHTGDARDGSASLAIAGSGGEAELLGAPIPVSPGSALSCRVWAKPKAFAEGAASVGAVAETGAKDAWLAPIPLDTEDWREYQFACAIEPEEFGGDLRFCLRLSGEGLLSIDDLRYTVYEFDSQYMFADGNFELSPLGGSFAEWRTTSETPGGKATAQSESPLEGKQCLRLEGDGDWCVATWTSNVTGDCGGILLQGYARALNGDGFMRIEYYRGDERLEDSASVKVSSERWQPLYVNTDPARLERADRCLITLVAERNSETSKAGELVVDFDRIQVLVVKP